MLAGVSAAINTVTFVTPTLGAAVALLQFYALPRGTLLTRAATGAFLSGGVALGWEMTVNSSHSTPIKVEVVTGSAAIGAAAAVVGPAIIGVASM